MNGFDIDSTTESSFDLPPLLEPALTLRDLDRIIQIARACPPEAEVHPLDPGSYAIGLPGGEAIRVTTDREVFDFSADNFQLFSPGGVAFNAFSTAGVETGASGFGVAWMLQRPTGEPEFVVATLYGPRTISTFEELIAALNQIGEPCEFPLTAWPESVAIAIA